MRRAYKSFTTIQDNVLTEAEKKPMSNIRTTSMISLCKQYQRLEALYFDAYSKADQSFKDAALKANKQQIEKETLSLVREMSKNQELLKDSFQHLLIMIKVLLTPEQLAQVDEIFKMSAKEQSEGPFDKDPKVIFHHRSGTSLINIHPPTPSRLDAAPVTYYR